MRSGNLCNQTIGIIKKFRSERQEIRDLEKFLKRDKINKIMAERARFELARPLRAYLRSRQADSTTLPSLRIKLKE